MTTRSPGATLETPAPTVSTYPAPSWPSTVGAYPDGSTPEAVYMSVWQTPQAASRTSTSPGLGSARSTSVTRRGVANSSSTAARIFNGGAPFRLVGSAATILAGRGGQLGRRVSSASNIR